MPGGAPPSPSRARPGPERESRSAGRVCAVDLVCVGDVMLDIRVDADALKRGGDVHGRVLLQPGGTSSNAAVWAAWAGASSRVHGRIGDDLPGRTITGALAERGVDVAVTVDPAAPTGTMLVLHEPGERSMVADRGANARLAPGDLPPRIEAGAVLVSGYLLLHPEGHDAAMAALERAEASWVGVEAASWPLVEAFGVERFFEASASANAVFANDQEARTLTGSRRRGCGPAAGGALPAGGGEAGRTRGRARRRRRALRRRDHADHRTRPHGRGGRVRRRGAGVVGTRRRSRRGARARVPGRRHGRGQPRCLARGETRDGRVVRRGARDPRRAARGPRRRRARDQRDRPGAAGARGTGSASSG